MQYKSGDFCYECVENWGIEAKQRWGVKEVAGIGVDSQDQIYLLSRVQPPVIVLTKEGKVVDWFGGGVFVRPHGLYLNPDGSVLGVDDAGHAVYRFDPKHELVQVIGTRGVPSDTGCINKDYKTIQQSAGPFNDPTRLARDSQGMIYVTDGYGNARVHKFDTEGNLIKSWGEPGDAPGCFNLPHGIAIDQHDILYVADRQNHRIQRFTTDGDFIDQWTGLYRPSDLWIDREENVFVAECKRSSVFDDEPSRISIFDMDGNLQARLGGDGFYDLAQGCHCAHGMVVDSEGSLYIAEVGKNLPDSFFGVKKYRRIR